MFLALCTIQQFHSQESNGVVALALPVRNSLKFNRYAINPTFSFVREQNKYVSFTNKRQWAQFNDTPNSYLFSYAGRFSENIGAGVSLFQQDFGVLTTFGGILNFAYNASLSRESNLTFGLNIGAYQSSLNQGRVIVNTPDPSLQNVPSNFLLTVNPGINYGTDFLDFGVVINNLVSYNLNDSKIIEDNPEQGLQAHIMYTGYMNTRGFFDESRFSTLVRSEFKKDQTVISGIAMLNVPKGVWAQVGYNTLYGASAGIGLNVTNNIAVEYNYEQSMGNLSEFGSSHEITLAYRFNNKYRYNYGDEEEEQSVFNTNKRRVKPNNLTDEDRDRIAQRRAEIAAKRKAEAEAEKAKAEIADTNAQNNISQNETKATEIESTPNDNDTEDTAKAEEARLKLEEAAKLKKAQEQQLKAENERKRVEEEERLRQEAAQKKIEAEKEKAEKELQLQREAEARKAKIEAEAKAKAEEEKRLKIEAEQRAKETREKAAAEAVKLKAEEEARIKQEEEQKRIEEQARLQAQEKARKEQEVEKLRLEAEAKAKAQEEKRLQLEAEKLKAEAKAKADEEARLKREADLKAEEERKRIEAEANAKLETEKLKDKVATETEANETSKIEAETNDDEPLPEVDDEAAKAMNALLDASKSIRKAQDELIERLSNKIDNKQKDLNDLKEENDLSEQGIYLAPKPFKSSSAENAEIAALKDEIGKIEKEQEIKMIELEALLVKRKRKFKKDTKGINDFYFNALEGVKADQLRIKNTKERLVSNLEQINEDTDFERKRRIRRAAYDNQQDRYNKDKAALERIKKFTDESTDELQEEDFDFGEEQTKNIQIIKNVMNEEPGYYMVIAVHNSVEKRDEFLTNVVASGEKNVNFFFDVKTNKYFIYYEKFDSISQAKNALDQKGSKPYNGKMSLVKIDN